MKKYLLSALAIALIGASITSIAQSTPMDHSSHGMAGNQGSMMGMISAEMQTMREAMQKKMSEAKTDEERQALMAEQQKLMLEKHDHKMSSNGGGHGMKGMSGNMAEHQQMMHKRMGMGMMPM
jgi:hypothetical protein